MGMQDFIGHEDYRNDAWELIHKRIEKKYRKEGGLFKRSIKEMKELFAEYEVITKDFQYLIRSLKVGIKNRKYEKTRKRMKEWPEELDTYVEIVLSVLGEEWENAEEVFTDAFVNSVSSCVGYLNELMGKGRDKENSTKALEAAIQAFLEQETFENAEKIGEIFKKMKSSLDMAAYYLEVEKKLLITDHLMAQQLLGNKFLRDNVDLLARETEKRMEIYLQALERKRIEREYKARKKGMPEMVHTERTIKITTGKGTDIQKSIHFQENMGEVRCERVILYIKFLEDKRKLDYMAFIWYEAEKDRFRSSVQKRNVQGWHDDFREFVFTNLSDFLEDIPRYLLFVTAKDEKELDLSRRLGKIPLRLVRAA